MQSSRYPGRPSKETSARQARLCMACHEQPWCGITIGQGGADDQRLCFHCWVAAYRRRQEQKHEATDHTTASDWL